MNQQLKSAKVTIRQYLADVPTERIAEMLAFAQDGHMLYQVPCQCLVGSRTAPTHVHLDHTCHVYHYSAAYRSAGGHNRHKEADYAYCLLGNAGQAYRGWYDSEITRQRRIVPILKAILRLRMRAESSVKRQAEELAEAK
jgi:hypothetical protein